MTEKNGKKLGAVNAAPHIKSSESILSIMLTMLAALVPVSAYSIYLFGTKALALMLVSAATAIAGEAVVQAYRGERLFFHYGTALIIGLLISLFLPVSAPLWLAVAGPLFALLIIKGLFGRFGFDFFNPVMGAAAFLMVFWPFYMKTGGQNFSGNIPVQQSKAVSWGLTMDLYNSITYATPLSLPKPGPVHFSDFHTATGRASDFLFSWDGIKLFFTGNTAGFIGDASAILIFAGCLILLYRRIITWHIPVSFLSSLALLTFIFYRATGVSSAHLGVLSQLFSGGVFFGAIFVVTDMFTSPVTDTGRIIFGIGCGVITFLIRVWGGFPEGLFFAILIMNSLIPLIDRYVRPRVFGT